MNRNLNREWTRIKGEELNRSPEILLGEMNADLRR